MKRTAPGKSHCKGITLAQLFKTFPDDETTMAWVERTRWPDGPSCPHCGGGRIAHPVKHKTMTHRCKGCRKWFSVRTGTCMESSRLGLQTWVIAVYLLNTGLEGRASIKLHRDLGVTQKTMWRLAHRIREAWEDNSGRRKNIPKAKRAARGGAGRSIVAGAKDQMVATVAGMAGKRLRRRELAA